MEKKQIKKIICLGSLVFLLSCSHHKMMSPNFFQLITVQSPIESVIEQYGPPYDVEELGSGILQYRYIQRNQVTAGVMEYTYFILIVSADGHILQKKTETVGAGSGLNYR